MAGLELVRRVTDEFDRAGEGAAASDIQLPKTIQHPIISDLAMSEAECDACGTLSGLHSDMRAAADAFCSGSHEEATAFLKKCAQKCSDFGRAILSVDAARSVLFRGLAHAMHADLYTPPYTSKLELESTFNFVTKLWVHAEAGRITTQQVFGLYEALKALHMAWIALLNATMNMHETVNIVIGFVRTVENLIVALNASVPASVDRERLPVFEHRPSLEAKPSEVNSNESTQGEAGGSEEFTHGMALVDIVALFLGAAAAERTDAQKKEDARTMNQFWDRVGAYLDMAFSGSSEPPAKAAVVVAKTTVVVSRRARGFVAFCEPLKYESLYDLAAAKDDALAPRDSEQKDGEKPIGDSIEVFARFKKPLTFTPSAGLAQLLSGATPAALFTVPKLQESPPLRGVTPGIKAYAFSASVRQIKRGVHALSASEIYNTDTDGFPDAQWYIEVVEERERKYDEIIAFEIQQEKHVVLLVDRPLSYLVQLGDLSAAITLDPAVLLAKQTESEGTKSRIYYAAVSKKQKMFAVAQFRVVPIAKNTYASVTLHAIWRFKRTT